MSGIIVFLHRFRGFVLFFVFPEKGPGTSTRAREFLPFSPLYVVVVNTLHWMYDMKLSLSLVKGCVTENSNVPLISTIQVGFSNCTGRDRSGHFLILLSRDSTPGINLLILTLPFKKCIFLVLILKNFRGRFV